MYATIINYFKASGNNTKNNTLLIVQ